MPRIQVFDSCQININPRDHMPPHFHVIVSDGREWLVRIDDCEVLEGPRDIRLIHTPRLHGRLFRRTGNC